MNKEKYKWKSRILLVITPNFKNQSYQKVKKGKKEEIDFVKSHQVTGRFCELRNNTPLENLKSGMGDIFIKLAR